MSDQIFRERAARRTRLLLIVAALIAGTACLSFSVASVFRDNCTGNFDRNPRAVISSYVNGITNADASVLRKCWAPEAFFELESGCSEICLSRFLGARYKVIDISLNAPTRTATGRSQLLAEVTITCTENGETHTGEIQLDSLATNVPWKHWKIERSTFGGTPAQVWCKP